MKGRISIIIRGTTLDFRKKQTLSRPITGSAVEAYCGSASPLGSELHLSLSVARFQP